MTESNEETESPKNFSVNVLLPQNRIVEAIIPYKTQIADLRNLLCTKFKLSPQVHSIDLMMNSDSKSTRSSTKRKSSLQVSHADIKMVILKSQRNMESSSDAQPPHRSENTVRLIVRLTRQRQSILRVNPNASLQSIFNMIASKLHLDKSVEETLEFRHPSHGDKCLDMELTLNDYKIRDIYLMEKIDPGSIETKTRKLSASTKRKAPGIPPPSPVSEAKPLKKNKKAPAPPPPPSSKPEQEQNNNDEKKKKKKEEEEEKEGCADDDVDLKSEEIEATAALDQVISVQEIDIVIQDSGNSSDADQEVNKEEENPSEKGGEERREDVESLKGSTISDQSSIADVIIEKFKDETEETLQNKQQFDQVKDDDGGGDVVDASPFVDDETAEKGADTCSTPSSLCKDTLENSSVDDVDSIDGMAPVDYLEDLDLQLLPPPPSSLFDDFPSPPSSPSVHFTTEESSQIQANEEIVQSEKVVQREENVQNEVVQKEIVQKEKVVQKEDVQKIEEVIQSEKIVQSEEHVQKKQVQSVKVVIKEVNFAKTFQNWKSEENASENAKPKQETRKKVAAVKKEIQQSSTSPAPMEEDPEVEKTEQMIKELHMNIEQFKKRSSKKSLKEEERRKFVSLKQQESFKILKGGGDLNDLRNSSPKIFKFIPAKEPVKHEDFAAAPVGGVQLLNNGEIKSHQIRKSKSKKVEEEIAPEVTHKPAASSGLPSYYKKFLGANAFKHAADSKK